MSWAVYDRIVSDAFEMSFYVAAATMTLLFVGYFWPWRHR